MKRTKRLLQTTIPAIEDDNAAAMRLLDKCPRQNQGHFKNTTMLIAPLFGILLLPIAVDLVGTEASMKILVVGDRPSIVVLPLELTLRPIIKRLGRSADF
jgi:hypothetical protein